MKNMTHSHSRHLQQTPGIEGEIVMSEQQNAPVTTMHEALADHDNATCVPFMLSIACLTGLWTTEIEDVDTRKLVAQTQEVSRIADYGRALGWSNVRGRIEAACEELLDLCRQCFPDGYFNMVDVACVSQYTPRTLLPALLQEAVRSCRKRGVVRWVESAFPTTSSPVCNQFFRLLGEALHSANLGCYPDEEQEIQQELPLCMKNHLDAIGCQQIRHMPLLIDVSKGTAAHFQFGLQMSAMLQCVGPFLCDMGVITEDVYQELRESLCAELRESGFCGRCTVYVVWGRVIG